MRTTIRRFKALIPLRIALHAFFLVIAILGSVARAHAQPPVTSGQEPELARAFDEYLAAILREEPVFATELGLHDHDVELPSFAPEAIARRRAITVRALDALARIDRARLLAPAHADLRFLVGRLRADLVELDEIRSWERDPDVYTSRALSGIHALFKRDFAPLCDRVKTATARIQGVPRLLAEGRKHLRAPARLLTEIAIEQAQGAVEYFERSLPEATRACADEATRRKLDHARSTALRAMRSWKSYLVELLPRAKGTYALGADVYARTLALEESIDSSLAELRRRGETEIARLQAEVVRTAKRIDPARSPREVMEMVNALHPAPDELLPSFRAQMKAIRAFMIDRHIIPMPPGENLVITETPPWERALVFAAMDVPGPFERGALPGFFYVTPVEPGWSEKQKEEHLRAFDRFAIENTILHEAYPGHYVQEMYARLSPSKIRRVLRSHAFIEGWALYCEQMMLEQGQNEDPRAFMAMLQWALVRAGRYLYGTAMHTGGMSLEEVAKHMEERAYLSPANAMREAKRFASDPFVLVYQLGKLQILDLRDELRKREGARFDLGAFHKRLLETAGLPLAISRDLMLRP